MKWNIEFYSKKIQEDIHKWPEGMQAKFIHIVELIEKSGPIEIGMPHIKSLGHSLFEIRAKK